jgi:hypothetical protein
LRPTNQLRIKGTRNLIDAAIAAHARRVLVESMVFIYGYETILFRILVC